MVNYDQKLKDCFSMVKVYQGTTSKPGSKLNGWLTDGSTWFQAVAVFLYNDNHMEPLVSLQLSFEIAPEGKLIISCLNPNF